MDDILPARGIGFCYGPSGAGKTFGVLDMALAVARGVPFAGSIEVQAGLGRIHRARSTGGVRKRIIKAYQHEKGCDTADFAPAGLLFDICDAQSVAGLVEKLAAFEKTKRQSGCLSSTPWRRPCPARTRTRAGPPAPFCGACTGGFRRQSAGASWRSTTRARTRAVACAVTPASKRAWILTLEIVPARPTNRGKESFGAGSRRKLKIGSASESARLLQACPRTWSGTAKRSAVAVVESIEHGEASVRLSEQQREILNALDEVVISKNIDPIRGSADIPDGVQAVDGKDLFTTYHTKPRVRPMRLQRTKRKLVLGPNYQSYVAKEPLVALAAGIGKFGNRSAATLQQSATRCSLRPSEAFATAQRPDRALHRCARSRVQRH